MPVTSEFYFTSFCHRQKTTRQRHDDYWRVWVRIAGFHNFLMSESYTHCTFPKGGWEDEKDGVKIVFWWTHDSSSNYQFNTFRASSSSEIQISKAYFQFFLLPHDRIAQVIAQRRSNSGIHSARWVLVYSTHRRLGIARAAAARTFIHGCSSSLRLVAVTLWWSW